MVSFFFGVLAIAIPAYAVALWTVRRELRRRPVLQGEG